MSSFDLAIPTVLKNEGGYVDDKNDSGGATNFGISQKFLNSINCPLLASSITREIAISLYRDNFWQAAYNQIGSQRIATKVFDFAVNMGSKQANKLLQRAVRAASGEKLDDDGILGSVSISAINSCNSDILLAAFKSEAAGYYRSLRQSRFVNGWLNRAYS